MENPDGPWGPRKDLFPLWQRTALFILGAVGSWIVLLGLLYLAKKLVGGH